MKFNKNIFFETFYISSHLIGLIGVTWMAFSYTLEGWKEWYYSIGGLIMIVISMFGGLYEKMKIDHLEELIKGESSGLFASQTTELTK